MTSTEVIGGGAPHRHTPGAGAPRGRRPELSGVVTVIQLELRQRIRSVRWRWGLAAWMLLLAALTALLWTTFGDPAEPSDQASAGSLTFTLLAYVVLGLGGLVAPALSATSINGDRAAGVLATLQATLLTPLEIALGKLLAAWLTALAMLATALPFLLLSLLRGGISIARFVVVVLLVAVMLLVVCAIGLGWSATSARTSSSSALTTLTVTLVWVGLPILFFLSFSLVREEVTVRAAFPDVQGNCVNQEYPSEILHTERVWWLLAANPFVVIADAAPLLADEKVDDPYRAISNGVRQARVGVLDGAGTRRSTCDAPVEDPPARPDPRSVAPVWPIGLAANLAIGGGFFTVAVLRLRTPAGRLPSGTRIA